MGNLQTAIINAGLAVVIIGALAYLVYMVGLILVLRKLGRVSWMAFLPLLNYYAQVRALNAPARWFPFAMIPYIGVVYAGTVAIRLGSVFGRGPAFSLVWLTVGAPAGMFMLAFSKEPLHLGVLRDEATLLDIKALKRRH
jgi:hypothetical protein